MTSSSRRSWPPSRSRRKSNERAQAIHRLGRFLAAPELLLIVVVLLQIGYRLFTGEADARLADFGSRLSAYAAQIGCYVTGASEQKPWPFMEWPAGSGLPPAVPESPADKA